MLGFFLLPPKIIIIIIYSSKMRHIYMAVRNQIFYFIYIYVFILKFYFLKSYFSANHIFCMRNIFCFTDLYQNEPFLMFIYYIRINSNLKKKINYHSISSVCKYVLLKINHVPFWL